MELSFCYLEVATNETVPLLAKSHDTSGTHEIIQIGSNVWRAYIPTPSSKQSWLPPISQHREALLLNYFFKKIFEIKDSAPTEITTVTETHFEADKCATVWSSLLLVCFCIYFVYFGGWGGEGTSIFDFVISTFKHSN